MELLTRNNFEGWMQKLMERLDRQDELLLAMKAAGKQPTITEMCIRDRYEEIYPVTADPGLLCLLQQQITDANISSARDSLSLYFSNQAVLVLHSNPHFESFIIDDRIIV